MKLMSIPTSQFILTPTKINFFYVFISYSMSYIQTLVCLLHYVTKEHKYLSLLPETTSNKLETF